MCPLSLAKGGGRSATPTKDQLYGNSTRVLGSKKKDEEIGTRKVVGSKLRARSIQEFEDVLSSWQPAQMIVPSPLRVQKPDVEGGGGGETEASKPDILRLDSDSGEDRPLGESSSRAPSRGGEEQRGIKAGAFV